MDYLLIVTKVIGFSTCTDPHKDNTKRPLSEGLQKTEARWQN